MKLLVLLTILAFFAMVSFRVHAQGGRGAAADRRSGPAHVGAPSGQARPSASISSVPPAAAPVPAVPQGQVFSAPPAASQQALPSPQPGGGFAAPANSSRRPLVAIGETAKPVHPPHHPPHNHRPQRPIVHYRHHPTVVIVDTPYYTSSTVVTEVAPGVIREEPRDKPAPMAESRTRGPGQLAPFDPTPREVVERMLVLAGIKAGDLVYDLGAGDGRVAIAAAKKFGVKAVGFEIDAGLVKLARENIRQQGVEHLVEIRQQDFLTADLSRPSVVTLYLSYDGNLTLRPRLMSQLKPGTRVVSYTFDMAEWQAKTVESYRDAAGNSHMIYLWEIGGSLALSDGRR